MESQGVYREKTGPLSPAGPADCVWLRETVGPAPEHADGGRHIRAEKAGSGDGAKVCPHLHQTGRRRAVQHLPRSPLGSGKGSHPLLSEREEIRQAGPSARLPSRGSQVCAESLPSLSSPSGVRKLTLRKGEGLACCPKHPLLTTARASPDGSQKRWERAGAQGHSSQDPRTPGASAGRRSGELPADPSRHRALRLHHTHLPLRDWPSVVQAEPPTGTSCRRLSQSSTWSNLGP